MGKLKHHNALGGRLVCSLSSDPPELHLRSFLQVPDDLSSSDDDVVDGDEDELHKEANESHHHEPDGRTDRHLCELCCMQNAPYQSSFLIQNYQMDWDLHIA